jgi:protein-S-isoprenylcysteine O-methyltransferase Ste14
MAEKKLIHTLYSWRIRGAVIGGLAALVLAEPTPFSLLAAVVLCILGLLTRAWACCHIKKEKELAVTGPYRFTRNPLYFGNLILGLALSAASASWWVFLIFSLYFLVFYSIAIHIEKKRMEEKFPAEYQKFKEKVPLFFPRLIPVPGGKNKNSCWQQYRNNKEYRALIGMFAFLVLFLLKMMFVPWP